MSDNSSTDRSVFSMGSYGEWGETAADSAPSMYPDGAKAPGYLVYRTYPFTGRRQLRHAVAWFIDDADAHAYAAWRNLQPPDGPSSPEPIDQQAYINALRQIIARNCDPMDATHEDAVIIRECQQPETKDTKHET